MINNLSTNLRSGSIDVSVEGFTTYKYDLYFSTAQLSIVEGAPILQDSLFRLIEFTIYSEKPSLENGDYVIQLNEGISNTINNANYYDTYEVGTSDENEAVTIDAGVLRVNTMNSNYEFEFIGFDTMNNQFEMVYFDPLLEGFRF